MNFDIQIYYLTMHLTNSDKSNVNKHKTFRLTIRNYKEAKALLFRKLAIVLKVAYDELLTIWLTDKLLNTLEQVPSSYNILKMIEKRLKTKAI